MKMDANQAATIAVQQIVADLSDRRGLRQAWESIDDDIRDEIREGWVATIARAIESAGGGGRDGG